MPTWVAVVANSFEHLWANSTVTIVSRSGAHQDGTGTDVLGTEGLSQVILHLLKNHMVGDFFPGNAKKSVKIWTVRDVCYSQIKRKNASPFADLSSVI
jgi:hypothetical protein